MAKEKILIVDDDPHILELVKLYVEKAGFDPLLASSGKEALQLFRLSGPDLVLLDIMMPDKDGMDVLKEIRKTSSIPVIMLTAKGESLDKILGLELGADDYVVKPFDGNELMARVKAVLRRTKTAQEEKKELTLPGLTIDLSSYNVFYKGKKLTLPPKELELLYYLAAHPNRVFTRDQLLDQIWGYDYVGNTRTVDVHIKRLRENFSQDDPFDIETVWGVGYKFVY